MAKKQGSLIDEMKERIKNSGTGRKEVLYVAPDTKRRIRFLEELDKGYSFKFHGHWERGINALCGEEYGVDCPYCADPDEDIKETTMYAWTVWDADANARRILLYKATGITPVPALIEFFGEYGTIMDRDYTIKKTGKGQGSNITVLPGEISKFRNKKAVPYTKKQVIKLLAKAFPFNTEDVEADEDDEPKRRKSSGKKSAAKGNTKKRKEKSIQAKLEELDEDALREIALELGLSKKEIKGVDSDELVEMLVGDYDDEDLVEAYENYNEANDAEDDEEEDADEDDDDESEDDEEDDE